MGLTIENLKTALAAAGMVAIPGYTPEHKFRDPAVCRLIGIEDENSEINQEPFISRIHPEDRIRSEASFRSALLSGETVSDEFRVCLPGGRTRWILSKGIRMIADNRPRDYFILQDISERKLAEELLFRKTRELSLANEKLDRFSAIIAHDLKTPLTSIVMLTDLLGRAQSLEDVLEKSRSIKSVANRMSQLIDELLEFSKASSQAELPQERVSLLALIEGVKSNLAAAISDSHAKLEIETNLPEVHGSSSQLFQLLQNLISNALKYRADRAPVLRIGSREQSDHWCIWIKDNGIGLDLSQSENLFEPFQRFNTAVEGTGLGLAICKKIVERHGGRIWVESEVGVGSRFYFTLGKPATQSKR